MNWFSLTLAIILLQCAYPVADSFILDIIPDVIPKLLNKSKEWIQHIADEGSKLVKIPKAVLSASAKIWKTLVKKFEFTLPLEELGQSWAYYVSEDGVVRIITMSMNGVEDYLGELSSEEFVEELAQGHVKFWLYTRKNKYDYEELYIEKLKSKHFLKSKPLMVITHGWMSSGKTNATQLIKNALLTKLDVNAIVVDWSEISFKDYFIAASTVPFVGEKICALIKDMSLSKRFKVKPKDVRLVGHSLGAHVMGAAGGCLRNVNFYVSRLTGLDPARPFFEFPSIFNGLKKQDAQFVDVIHTNAGILGLFSANGHADFYPNGGVGQPGCYNPELMPIVCDHARSYHFFADSILEDVYEGAQCCSYIFYQLGVCSNSDRNPMGYKCEDNAEGRYYLQTDAPEVNYVF